MAGTVKLSAMRRGRSVDDEKSQCLSPQHVPSAIHGGTKNRPAFEGKVGNKPDFLGQNWSIITLIRGN
jgi:hypothetical protein